MYEIGDILRLNSRTYIILEIDPNDGNWERRVLLGDPLTLAPIYWETFRLQYGITVANTDACTLTNVNLAYTAPCVFKIVV